MKIVLIQPKHCVHPDRAFEPLNLGYLAAYLRSKGYNDIAIHIGAYESDRKIIADAAGADVVGMTATSPMMTHAQRLAAGIKRTNPEAVVVLGGSHPSALPESTLTDQNVDVVVRGEGEETLYELVGAIGNGSGFESVDGISYRRGEQIRHNPDRDFAEDVDKFPYPARDLLKQERFTERFCQMYGERAAWVLSSRGCPFECAFCASQCVWRRRWRARSPENVVGEIQQLISEYGITRLNFADDTFTVKKSRVLRFCELLEKEKINISWACNVHANTVDKEVLTAMKATGCKEIWVGVESGSPQILKELKKDTSTQKIKDVFKISKDVGIVRRAYLMIGSPSEDLNTIKETEALVDEIEPDCAGFTILTPFPGCELYERAKAEGYLYDDMDWSQVDLNRATLPTKGLSKDALNSEYQRLFRKMALVERKKKFSFRYLAYRGWIEVRATPIYEFPSLLFKFWRYLRLTLLRK